MRKFAFVSSEFITPQEKRTGGLGSYIWNISNLLVKNGHQVYVYAPLKVKINELTLSEGLHLADLPNDRSYFGLADRVKNSITRIFFGYSFFHYKKLKHHAKLIHDFLSTEHQKHQFDLVQYSNLGGIGLYPLKECSTILRISSLTDLYSRLGAGYYGLSQIKIQSQIRIENESYQKFDTIIGPSSQMLNKIETNAKKIRLISPLNQSEFNRTPSTNISNSHSLIFYGSVDYRKGVDLLLDAIEGLSVDVLVIGKLNDDSPENIKIKRRIMESNSVTHFHSKSKSELFELLSKAEVVVLPSRVDNLPNTLLESIQLGKIVIGPNAWGFEEIIEDGKNGFLFECSSSASLKLKIEEVLKLSKEERNVIKKKALETSKKISEDFSIKEVLHIYEESIINYQPHLCAE
ncbi:glycosyltransferase family 4 protein [Algoriphagus namhaensis]|uniref:Glycosyltransferase family 4 protein n=1 Tax=Algoriphagus namhaensis TaxID=915353 RepID=A0ABV8AVN0_9BACT